MKKGIKLFSVWDGNEIKVSNIYYTNSNVSLYYTEKNEEFYIEFDYSDLEHCCGVTEFGGLYITKGFSQEVFDSIMKQMTKGSLKIINTNGKYESVEWERLLENCPSFELVRTFKNPNSKNTIKVWLSKK